MVERTVAKTNNFSAAVKIGRLISSASHFFANQYGRAL
jgi:hypothetical protein